MQKKWWEAIKIILINEELADKNYLLKNLLNKFSKQYSHLNLNESNEIIYFMFSNIIISILINENPNEIYQYEKIKLKCYNLF